MAVLSAGKAAMPSPAPEIIGRSPPILEVFRTLAKVAAVDATVLVSGESGTGKELVARAIHRRSGRAEGPFVAVNCSAIPATLVEAEFFGYEKGSFTDATAPRLGKFEAADGGTLFLDEVGQLAVEAQAKLLRTLQDGELTRLGSTKPRPVDVRVVAATNTDLEEAVAEGRFREDLYWRLNVVHIRLPPLRERPEDVPLLIDHLLARLATELGIPVRSVAPEARRALVGYEWPGNVRELENVLCRAAILCEDNVIELADLSPRIRGEGALGEAGAAAGARPLTLPEMVREATERVEKAAIIDRLLEHHGHRLATADSLGISRRTLFNKLRHYRIEGFALEGEAEPLRARE